MGHDVGLQNSERGDLVLLVVDSNERIVVVVLLVVVDFDCLCLHK